LEGKEFMPLKWIVPKYLPEGVTLLAGKPKIGKSWLMLGTALAVTRGDLVLCERCEQRTVLYCALEDNERRMQARIDKIIGRAERWPVNGYLVYDLPTIGNGGIERLEQYTKDYPLDLIIVDTLARFRGSKRKDEDNYAADYRTMAELHNLGRRTGVSIIVVHHVRKATADDLFDTISGTMGLSGAADTLAILTRTDDQNGLRFATRGRDVEPEDKVVAFDSDLGEWTVVEDYEPEEKGTGNTASQIAAVLQAHGFGMTPKQVAEKLGAKENAIQQALRRMAKKGQARKNQYGVYEAV
jgi:DNA-binding NarL/FixJ family response regulator